MKVCVELTLSDEITLHQQTFVSNSRIMLDTRKMNDMTSLHGILLLLLLLAAVIVQQHLDAAIVSAHITVQISQAQTNHGSGGRQHVFVQLRALSLAWHALVVKAKDVLLVGLGKLGGEFLVHRVVHVGLQIGAMQQTNHAGVSEALGTVCSALVDRGAHWYASKTEIEKFDAGQTETESHKYEVNKS